MQKDDQSGKFIQKQLSEKIILESTLGNITPGDIFSDTNQYKRANIGGVNYNNINTTWLNAFQVRGIFYDDSWVNLILRKQYPDCNAGPVQGNWLITLSNLSNPVMKPLPYKFEEGN